MVSDTSSTPSEGMLTMPSGVLALSRNASMSLKMDELPRISAATSRSCAARERRGAPWPPFEGGVAASLVVVAACGSDCGTTTPRSWPFASLVPGLLGAAVASKPHSRWTSSLCVRPSATAPPLSPEACAHLGQRSWSQLAHEKARSPSRRAAAHPSQKRGALTLPTTRVWPEEQHMPRPVPARGAAACT